MEKKSNPRRNLLIFLFVFSILGAVFYKGFSFFFSGNISTDNAYTAADMAEVCAAVGGVVKDIHVTNTQYVKKGDILVDINDVDANIEISFAKSSLEKAEANIIKAQSDYDRRKFLEKSGSTSKEEILNAESALKIAHAEKNFAKVSLEQAELNLSRTKITAPFDGIISQRKVQLGQKVTAGTHLLSVVPLSQIYVNANFKETELQDVKIGQKVILTSDFYGKSVVYNGKVVGFSGGTGSAFALIPAQNATGNWIKVIQRLPVRIELEPESLEKKPLYIGLSMHVRVDTRSSAVS